MKKRVAEDKKILNIAKDRRFYRLISNRKKETESQIYKKVHFGQVFFTENPVWPPYDFYVARRHKWDH